jgi:hypothetical protein
MSISLTYHDTLPAWRPMSDQPGDAAQWSGVENYATPPAIGARVRVGVNGLGFGVVTGYYVEEGFLGVTVMLESPPAHREGLRSKPCHTFGAELRDLKAGA